jgi:hypothetical protein
VNLAISAYLTTGDLQASAPVDFPIAQRVQVEERDPGVEGLRPPLYGGFRADDIRLAESLVLLVG